LRVENFMKDLKTQTPQCEVGRRLHVTRGEA
jgi:hypothetical protein